MSDFLPLGTLVQQQGGGTCWVSLGSVGHMATLAWPLTAHRCPGLEYQLFSLALDAEPSCGPPWLVALSLESYQ
eukprot:11140708-Lingulodinium_polyedra.AAC.1